MYALFIANKNYSSWSLRSWLLMRHLGIPFEERMRPFVDGEEDVPRDFSPTGKVPCLLDGKLLVWDSLAIAEYLAERHDGVWPADAEARAFARSAAAEMHSGFQALRGHCPMSCGLTVKLHHVPEGVQADMRRISDVWNEGLSRFGGPFLAGGAFTAVDAFFAPIAFRMKTYGLDVEGDAAAYAPRLLALPALRQWYDEAIAETFRERGHEDEARTAGEWLEDRRATE